MYWIPSQDKGQGEHVLALHVARVKVLLDEDARIDSLQEADDEHDNGQRIWGNFIVEVKEAGEAEARPGKDKGPGRL